MKTFVSTLGFDTSHLYGLVVDEGVTAGDHLVLVRPDDGDSRGEEAVNQIESMVSKVDDEISTELVVLDPMEFEDSVVELRELLEDTEGDVVVNLAGGDRALVLALSIATMTTSDTVSSVYVRSDVTREKQEVRLPRLHVDLDDRDREMLRYVLDNAPVSNTRLASALDVSESTVSRRLEALENRGLVDVTNSGTGNSVEPALTGRLQAGRLD